MENITDLMGKASKQITAATDGLTDSTQPQTPSQTSLTDLDQRIIDRLFVRLKAIFPKWREIWNTDDEIKAAKRQWMRSIVSKGVADPSMLKLGIDRAEVIGWVRPPSPAQFCEWCIDAAKALAGIPSQADAISQIMTVARRGDHNRRHTKMTPAIYQMYRFIDWYSFSQKKTEDAEKMAARAYDEMVDHWRSGLPFAEQPIMIEEHKPSGVVTKSNRDAGRAAMKELMKGMVK